MFIESAKNPGSIEVICGSMFSGKTEELIRRLKRAKFANLNVEIFKPKIDVRYSDAEVVSHDSNTILSTPVDSSNNILLLTGNVDVVGIDEAQFFDQGIVDVVQQLAAQGIRVIIAGLDMDYLGNPFGPMPALMAVAEYVTKVRNMRQMRRHCKPFTVSLPATNLLNSVKKIFTNPSVATASTTQKSDLVAFLVLSTECVVPSNYILHTTYYILHTTHS